jgi:hypothetical protein
MHITSRQRAHAIWISMSVGLFVPLVMYAWAGMGTACGRLHRCQTWPSDQLCLYRPAAVLRRSRVRCPDPPNHCSYCVGHRSTLHRCGPACFCQTMFSIAFVSVTERPAEVLRSVHVSACSMRLARQRTTDYQYAELTRAIKRGTFEKFSS